MFKIEDAEVPRVGKETMTGQLVAALKALEVGQMFFVPDGTCSRSVVATHAYVAGLYLDCKFVAKRRENGIRVMRIA